METNLINTFLRFTFFALHMLQTTIAPNPSSPSLSSGFSPHIACTIFLHFKHLCAPEEGLHTQQRLLNLAIQFNVTGDDIF